MKRIIRLFLVMALLVSSIPVDALATDEVLSTAVSETQTDIPQPEATVSLPAEIAATPKPEVVAEKLAPEITTESTAAPPATIPMAVATPPVVQPSLYPPVRPVVISAFQSTNAAGFIELYNHDTNIADLNNWRIEVTFTDDSICTIQIEGYIHAKKQVLLTREGSFPEATNSQKYDCGDSQKVAKTLAVYDTDTKVEHIDIPQNATQVWQRKGLTATYFKGDFANDFKLLARELIDDSWYYAPHDPNLTILEVLVNPKECTNYERDDTCYDFVKIKNTTDKTIDLSQYRLRSGFRNASSSSSNTFYVSGSIAPGAMLTITETDEHEKLSFTANDGIVWFEDIEGVAAYPTNVLPYVDSHLTGNKGRSWAYDSDAQQWRWGIPSPDGDNTFPIIVPGMGSVGAPSTLKPCRDDQYRSEETNRCRTVTTASTLAACKEGQYRSEETNRCRSIAAAASVAKACADDQFRNPLTNRCKKIASADDASLADCGEGRERNPASNRCRNVLGASVPAAAFAVEPVKQGPKAFVGWWALGGVVAVAVGYAAWEWRREVALVARRAINFVRIRK